MYQQLAQLIRDGVWLKSYIAAVMRVEQEAFTTAYNAMGPTKVGQSTAASLPVTESVVTADRGALGTNPVAAQQQVPASHRVLSASPRQHSVVFQQSVPVLLPETCSDATQVS